MNLQQSYVFCDTAPLLTAVYSDILFGDTSLYPRARALHARYAMTLVLEPDLPWIADGIQRDGAHVQGPVHAKIMQELQSLRCTLYPVAGTGPARTAGALAAVQTGIC